VVKKILDISKKYWIALACGAVALLGFFAALVYPLPGMITALQTKVDERKNVYVSVERLRNADRQMPVLDLEKPEPEELPTFPNQAVIDAGEKATTEVNLEATKMLEQAVRMNTHTLLLENSLPSPSEPLRFQFRDRYLQTMEQDPTRQPNRPLYFKDTILNGIFPPQPLEIDTAKQQVTEKYAALMGPTAGVKATAENKEMMEIEISQLPQNMRSARATEGRIYLNADALAVNLNIRGNAAPSAEAIWSAQLMVWFQEDLCRAIAATNEAALSRLSPDKRKDVTNSPIKHLLKVTIPPDPRVAVGEPHLEANTPLPEQGTASLTKRVSNALFETYRFTVSMNVETSKIPVILQELSRNQFLTITRVDATGIDSLAALQQGYVYGTERVATLNMDCEVLYMRKWAEPLMPPMVKQRLTLPGDGVPTQDTGGGFLGRPGFFPEGQIYQ